MTSNRFPPALWERVLWRAQAGHAPAIRMTEYWIAYINEQKAAWRGARRKA